MVCVFGWLDEISNIQNLLYRDKYLVRSIIHDCPAGRNHLIFANYKKAYGTRGYEVKTLIIIKKNKKSTPGHAITRLV
jgi:hypothetical protein